MNRHQRTGQVIPISAAVRRLVPGDDPARVTDDEIAAWRRRRDATDADRIARGASRTEAMRAAGFPQRAVDFAATVDERHPVITRLRDWDDGGRRDDASIMILSGPKGIGKTVAAAWWALRRKPAPVFLRASTFAASSRYARDERERWMGAAALVLDDLGAEYADGKGSFLVDLDELVDVFYGDCRSLLITTNCGADAFKARYGERIADRIRECGVFFEWSGPSFRGRA